MGKGNWNGDVYVISGVFAGNAFKSEVVQKLQAENPISIRNTPCTDSGDGTFTGTDGTVWQLCLYGQTYANGRCEGSPKNVSWYEAMNAAKDSRFAGKNDWIVPTKAFLKGSIHPEWCAHPNIQMSMRTSRYAPPELLVSNYFWTGSVYGTGTECCNNVLITNRQYSGGYVPVYYDTQKSTVDFDKSFDPIYAVFARNTPETDKQDFSRTLPYVKCDARCLSDRKAAQTKNDDASARRGEEWRAGLFGGGNSSRTANNDRNSKVDWTITSEENGGGLANWYTKKYNAKCTSGRKSGERITIHLLKSSGKYQEVSGSVKNSLAEAARDACS